MSAEALIGALLLWLGVEFLHLADGVSVDGGGGRGGGRWTRHAVHLRGFADELALGR